MVLGGEIFVVIRFFRISVQMTPAAFLWGFVYVTICTAINHVLVDPLIPKAGLVVRIVAHLPVFYVVYAIMTRVVPRPMSG